MRGKGGLGSEYISDRKWIRFNPWTSNKIHGFPIILKNGFKIIEESHIKNIILKDEQD